MKIFFLIFVVFITSLANIKAEKEFNGDKGIGLTLSGGGARGFAHIGVLHVLDSLGVRINFVSGTSMGSVVGGMYASGYSPSEIEKFVKEIDWDLLFSSRVNVNYIHPRRRETIGRHIISLPFEKGRFVLPSGAIEGQHLWNTLGEVFFPVHYIRDFSQLQIPFACVATDLETGEAVIIKEGDLVSAIRASMAIPSIFTAVNRNDLYLIDGGVVNNFPVNIVREMGAELVIGVNVSHGLRSADKLRTPIDVIYQMGFFRDAISFQENRQNTDVFIEPDLEDFSSSSFSDTAEIIERGKEAARNAIPDLLKMAAKEFDLEAVKPDKDLDDVGLILESIDFEGLENIKEWFVLSRLGLHSNDTLTSSKLNNAINRLFASGYFRLITYSFEPGSQKDRFGLVLYFEENPYSRLALSLHYGSFTGVGLIGEVRNTKFFIYNLNAYAKAMVGEKPAAKAGLDYYLSNKRNNWLNLESRANYLIFPLYESFNKVAEYRQGFWRGELSYNHLTGNDSYASLGMERYGQSLAPNLFLGEYARGETAAFKINARWKLNSFDRHAFPRTGQLLHFYSSFYFGQKPSMTFYNALDGTTSSLEDVGIEIGNFLQTSVNWVSNIMINDRLTSYTQVQGAYNFFYNQGFLNAFNLGGTYPFLENQLTFSGLNEYELISSSIITAGMGWRYNVWNDFYLCPLINVGVYDFEFLKLGKINKENFVLGTGLDVGYLSAVGPLELTFSYSPQSGRILAYLNLGWTFNSR